MTGIMIDIETYSTANNAAIVQLGACTLDEKETFLISIDPEVYKHKWNRAFDIDPKTVAWWDSQPLAARDGLKLRRVGSVEYALDEFCKWLKSVGFKASYGGQPSVWANPPSFDLTILRNAFDVCEFSRPWHYRQERCFRTLLREFGSPAVPCPEDGLTKHRADHDAIRQARSLNAIMSELRGDNNGK